MAKSERAQESKPELFLGNSAAIFSHEAVNSLALISSSLQYVDAAVENQDVDANVLKTTLERAIREIDDLASSLREFCLSVVQSQRLKFEIGDLTKVVEDVLALQSFACRAAGVAIKFECENALPAIRLDSAKIKQVILNLCKNAVEAMPQGGCLTVELYQHARSIVLEISDSGIGLPDDVNVFELFTTTKLGGKGIGLFIVQQIVTAHEGTITHWSKPGCGTGFKVVFPIAK
jgi:signal transduction histidine kinase